MESFIKNYNEEIDEGYLFGVDIQYLKNLYNLRNDLPFFPERIKIENIEKVVANLHDKTEYVIDIRNLKKALNQELVLKKVHIVIKFKWKSLAKTVYWYEHRAKKKAKDDIEKDFFKLMNNLVFGKTKKNVGKHRNIKLLISEPNYHKVSLFHCTRKKTDDI